MTTVEFNELINTIKQLGTKEVSWIDYRGDFTVALVSSVLAALFAFWIAWFQVDRSRKQQELQRKEDIKQQEKYRAEDRLQQEQFRREDVRRQKLFMIEELKIENAQKFINYTKSFHTNIMNMINYGNVAHDHHVNENDPVQALDSISRDSNLLIFENSEALELHLNILYTIMESFDFEQQYRDLYKVFEQKIHQFHNSCIRVSEFNEYESAKIGQECINLANLFDKVVREELSELIKKMITPEN